MKKIASFTIDHNQLKKGVYVSRKDRFAEQFITTFDIRMKEPSKKEALTPPASHTIEHLLATYFRLESALMDEIVFVGPMGCLTGMYILVHGEMTSEEFVKHLIPAFEYVVSFVGAVPGATEIECGNSSLHDLSGAIKEGQVFLELLNHIEGINLNYPAL